MKKLEFIRFRLASEILLFENRKLQHTINLNDSFVQIPITDRKFKTFANIRAITQLTISTRGPVLQNGR